MGKAQLTRRAALSSLSASASKASVKFQVESGIQQGYDTISYSVTVADIIIYGISKIRLVLPLKKEKSVPETKENLPERQFNILYSGKNDESKCKFGN